MVTMTATEFRDKGYLLEVNRLFLHPRGLALAVTCCTHEDHEPSKCRFKARLGPIFDARSDPEGVLFESFTEEDHSRAAQLAADFASRLQARAAKGCDPQTGVEPLA